VHGHHDAFEVGRSLDAAFGPHEQRFLALVDAPRSVVAVVGADRGFERERVHAARRHAHRVRNHFETARVTAEHVDVGNAGHRA
jgi:hypothetical protein